MIRKVAKCAEAKPLHNYPILQGRSRKVTAFFIAISSGTFTYKTKVNCLGQAEPLAYFTKKSEIDCIAMYDIPSFKERDPQLVLQFLHDHPFAVVTGSFKNGNQVATQIPLLIEERADGLYAKGHIMRNTTHHQAFMENSNVLALFTGAHAYVSASWYSNPYNGSTWNYMSVHLYGKVSFMTEEALITMMQELSLHFENKQAHSPTVYENLPEAYRESLIKAIVGIEIKVETLEQVFKLSQNKDQESYENIIRQLETIQEPGHSQRIAAAMRKRKTRLFPPNQP